MTIVSIIDTYSFRCLTCCQDLYWRYQRTAGHSATLALILSLLESCNVVSLAYKYMSTSPITLYVRDFHIMQSRVENRKLKLVLNINYATCNSAKCNVINTKINLGHENLGFLPYLAVADIVSYVDVKHQVVFSLPRVHKGSDKANNHVM